MPTLFVDTSAWCALFHAGDSEHANAVKIWQNLIEQRTHLFTSNDVFDETITLLRRRVGFSRSQQAGDKMLSSTILKRLDLTEREFLLSWEWYKKYKDHELSFTDCSSFVLMKEHKISRAWTLDQHFEAVGFETVK